MESLKRDDHLQPALVATRLPSANGIPSWSLWRSNNELQIDPSFGNTVAAFWIAEDHFESIDWVAIRALFPFARIGTEAILPLGEMQFMTKQHQITFGLQPNEPRMNAWTAGAVEHWRREQAERLHQRDLGLRNRQLQNLQEQLERTVNDRTAYLRHAERELYKRMTHARELVRFLKELSQFDQLEDILSLLARELKGFHQVRPPMLVYFSNETGPQILFRRTSSAGSTAPTRSLTRSFDSGWTTKGLKRVWPQHTKIRFGSVADQSFWAQELERPTARILSVPLDSTQIQIRESQRAALLFEYDYHEQEQELEKFLSHLMPRLEPVAATIDRVLFNNESRLAARAWEMTFDGLRDPIALVSSNGEILRMNRAYQLLADQIDSHWDGQVKAESSDGRLFKFDGATFQLRVFKMSLNEGSGLDSGVYVHHFSSVGNQVEVRSRAIQNEKMAAIGLMAGNIAHELNNPLAGLRSLAQVLAANMEFPPSVIEDLKQIEFAADRSSGIIRELLGFSGSGLSQLKVFRTQTAIGWAINMAKTAIHEHNLNWNENGDPLLVKGDPHLLTHVLFNLINNACQAMGSMGELFIEAKRVDDQVQILVADSGPGISSDLRKRIFEPFFTTKDVGHGTGLGLSMSRSLIEAMGGSVQLLDEPSTDLKGAHFLVRLPAASPLNVEEVKPQ